MRKDNQADEKDAVVGHVMSPHREHITGSEVAALITPGVRVARGPDWEYELMPHQEGTVKATGTVNGKDWMLVEWDNGTTGDYRMGVFQKYDLQLAPSSWSLMYDRLIDNDITTKQFSVDEHRLHLSLFVHPLPDFLRCEMCDDVLTSPCFTNCCQQSYCEECINSVISKKCPNCRELYGHLTPDSRSSRIINEQEVKCPYHIHDKCPWTGFSEDIEGHLSSCPYKPIECPNGCGKSYERRNMVYHINLQCQLGVLKCQDCECHVKFNSYRAHLTSSMGTSCPYGCTESVPTETIVDHMVKCPLRKVTCEFTGCMTEVVASEMDRHLNDAVQDHLMLLRDELVSVKQQTKQLQQQLVEERQARKSLEKNLTELNIKLNKLFTSQ